MYACVLKSKVLLSAGFFKGHDSTMMTQLSLKNHKQPAPDSPQLACSSGSWLLLLGYSICSVIVQ